MLLAASTASEKEVGSIEQFMGITIAVILIMNAIVLSGMI